MAKQIKTIQSIERAFEILHCFEKSEELGVTEISNMTKLHKSTAFNLIATLEHLGILEKDHVGGKYKLGMELFKLGTMVDSNVRSICYPYLERLVETYSETVNLVARDNLMVLYLEKIESPHSMRIGTKEGQRLPMHCTAVGKSIMSTFMDSELKPMIDNLSFVKFTDYTLTTPGELRDQLKEAKQKGYAEDIQEYENGLTCVAAPIKDHTGKAKFAISVSGPNSRMTKEFRDKIGMTLVEFTNEISKKLGY